MTQAGFNNMEVHNVNRTDLGGTQRRIPISSEDYERGRAVLDSLPPGVYLKCSDCVAWKRNGVITVKNIHKAPTQYLCERCGDR